MFKKLVKVPNNRELVILGKDVTCQSEYRGWGTGCESLILKEDGFYHCNDCGLVYCRPGRNEILEKNHPNIYCECSTLKEDIEWFFDTCHGYECPSSHYYCDACGRHYNNPPFAPLDTQESEAAKKSVATRVRFEKEQYEQKLKNIINQGKQFKKDLESLPDDEKSSILALLFS